MRVFPYQDGDQLIELVEKREINAAKQALEKVWPFLEEDDGDGANAPAYQAAINAVKAVITSKKGEQP